jgi:hypothetical protein
MGEAEVALGTLRRVLDQTADQAALAAVDTDPGNPLLNQVSDLQQRIAELAAHAAAVCAAAPAANVTQTPPPPTIPDRVGQGSDAKPARVEVADGLYVEAMVLSEKCQTQKEVLAAIRGPMLCYVPSWGHFAIRIGGNLIHGNVGRVLPVDAQRPVGVQECRDRSCRKAGCTFYHDPARSDMPDCTGCAPAADAPLSIRNHLAHSFCYSSKLETPRRPVRFGGRHFGSFDTLQVDLGLLSDAEARRFLDQVGHDLVCAAVLLQNRGVR